MRRALGFAAASCLGACGGGGGTDPGAALVLPLFAYAFVGTVLADDDSSPVEVRLVLTPQDPFSSGGSFIGASLSVSFTGGDDRFRVSGTFSGDHFSITVEGAVSPIAGSYDGRFTDRDTVRLEPTDGSRRTDGRPRPALVLRRDSAS